MAEALSMCALAWTCEQAMEDPANFCALIARTASRGALCARSKVDRTGGGSNPPPARHE